MLLLPSPPARSSSCILPARFFMCPFNVPSLPGLPTLNTFLFVLTSRVMSIDVGAEPKHFEVCPAFVVSSRRKLVG